MPSYTVTEVVGARPWPSKEDTQTIYYDVRLQDFDGLVDVGRKPGNPVTVGTVLDGEIQPTQFAGKFKFKRSNNGYGGGGGKGRSPEENAKIVRQHSQEMALRYAAIRAEKELLPNPFKLSDLKAVIDWFDADAKAAKP